MAGHSSSNLVCRICKDVFTNQTFLDQHFLALHPTNTSHHCDYCNEDFISELFLQIHTSEYHNSPPKMLTKQGSKSPDKNKSPIKSKSTDPKHFNSTSGYLQTRVYNALAKKDDNLFWCPVCFERFHKRENLREHFRSNHIFGSGSMYVCELCDIEKPSAEMLCWHLEVHSNNRLSVNRFSKLRTCVSSVKKESKEHITTTIHKDTSNIHSGVIELNDHKKLITKKNCFSVDCSIPETSLKAVATPKQEKKYKGKSNTVQRVTSSKLNFSLRKKQKRLQSQFKAPSLSKRKKKRLYLKKLLLQVNDSYEMKDETEQNSEVISGSAIKMVTDIAENWSSPKLEGNFIKCGSNNRLDGESGSISDKLLCEIKTSLEIEPTTHSTVTESSKIKLDHEVRNVIVENKVDTQLSFMDDSLSSFETKIVKSSVNSHKSNGGDVSSDLKNKLTSETLCNLPEKQSVIVKSILSKKGKSRFRNLRSSCPTKRKKSVLINTSETKQNNEDSNVKYDNLESNKNAMYNTEGNRTAENESSIVTLGDDETLNPISSETTQHNNVEGSSQGEVKRKSKFVNDEETSSKKSKEIPNSSKYKNAIQSVTNNVIGSKLEVPVKISRKQLRDNKLSCGIFRDDMTNKVQANCGNTCKESKTLFVEDEDCNKKEIDFKSTLCGSSAKPEREVTNTLASLENGSSGKDVFHSASNVFSKTTSEKIGSVESLKEINVENLEKSSTFEDPQVSVKEKTVLDENKDNSQSISPTVFKNSFKVQNEEPIANDSIPLKEVETGSTIPHSEDSKDEQKTEDSIDEPNELFEEIACDKCSLKFYNQDDLFDHLGTHYNI